MTVDFGFLAVPADAKGVSDADLYAGLLDSCAFHRDLGYRTAWFIEHHFSDYYPCPAPILSMAHIAARFPDLALGTCVLVTPWYEPLRLAGELAMLTNMTDQKLYIGLGRGTAKYEYDAFGVDMTEARERFAELWKVLDLAMSGERVHLRGRARARASRRADPPHPGARAHRLLRRDRLGGVDQGDGRARPGAHVHELRPADARPAAGLGGRRDRGRHARHRGASCARCW